MNQYTLVTVNILSFNRMKELQNTVTKVFEQDYKNIEVIVVDNASSDGSSEMVEKEFPEVKLIKLEKNIGIAGWNKGFEVARGEYVLVLDDDSYPDKDTIQKAVSFAQNDYKPGIICLPIFNKYFNRDETEHIDKDNPNTFIGCGALIRKEIFTKVGYFNDLLFLYEHEIEFSMRVINAGYKIKYCENAEVVHENSFVNRKIKQKSDFRRKYYLSRNYVLILFMHFSIKNISFFLPQLIFGRLFVSIFEKTFFINLSGFLSTIKLLPKILENRKLLSKDVQKFYNSGNYMGRFVKEKFI